MPTLPHEKSPDLWKEEHSFSFASGLLLDSLRPLQNPANIYSGTPWDFGKFRWLFVGTRLGLKVVLAISDKKQQAKMLTDHHMVRWFMVDFLPEEGEDPRTPSLCGETSIVAVDAIPHFGLAAIAEGDAEFTSSHQTSSAESQGGATCATLLVFGSRTDSGRSHLANEHSVLALGMVRQDVLLVSLDFVPFQITHSAAHPCMFFVSGLDQKVHMYLCKSNHIVETAKVARHMDPIPQLSFRSPVVCMAFFKGLYAFGLLNGMLCLFHPELGYACKTLLDGPLTSATFFHHRVRLSEDSNLGISLLVTSAVGFAVVFQDLCARDRETNWLAEPLLLLPDKHDSVLCGNVIDLTLDGVHEIVLGTHGQKMLAFRWEKVSYTYARYQTYVFSQPVMCIRVHAWVADGVDRLVVITLAGVSIFAVNRGVLIQRMRSLLRV